LGLRRCQRRCKRNSWEEPSHKPHADFTAVAKGADIPREEIFIGEERSGEKSTRSIFKTNMPGKIHTYGKVTGEQKPDGMSPERRVGAHRWSESGGPKGLVNRLSRQGEERTLREKKGRQRIRGKEGMIKSGSRNPTAKLRCNEGPRTKGKDGNGKRTSRKESKLQESSSR